MISHIVLFKPHERLRREQKSAILTALTGVINECPSVRSCRVGRRVRHGLPGYEQLMNEDYEYALLLEFDDPEGLQAYLQHPAHGRIGELFTSAAAASLAYDYQVVDLSDAPRLL